MLRRPHALLFAGALTACAAPPIPKNGSFGLAPFPSVVGFAKANGIPLGQPQIPDPALPSKTGDRVVFVAALLDADAIREWIIDLQRVDPLAAETQKSAGKRPSYYSVLGNVYSLTSDRAIERVRIAGPFLEPAYIFDPKASGAKNFTDRNKRFAVHQDYLEFGLNRAIAYFSRLGARLDEDPAAALPLSWNTQPFPAKAVAAAKAEAKRLQVTPEEDRLGCQVLPSLAEFFHIAEKTPGLREILMRVLAIPSYWSLLSHGGVGQIGFQFWLKDIRRLQERGTSIPCPLYLLPSELSLNGEPSLEVQLTVTEPRAPLATCAGIIALVASPPPGKKGSLFALKLVGARRGD